MTDQGPPEDGEIDSDLTEGFCGLLFDLRCCEDWADQPAWAKVRALEMAAMTLRSLTAGRAANCPVELRPCGGGCAGTGGTWSGGVWSPYLLDGRWYNACGCADTCGCAEPDSIWLPSGVTEVIQVADGAEILPADAYRVDSHHQLVRTDGGSWNLGQNLMLDPGSPDTLTVVYRPGVALGATGALALGRLACEYVKACTGGKCRLPKGVVSITRQGVQMDIQSGAFPGGVTGLPDVDVFIHQVNPHGLVTAPSVYSPDIVKRERVTTWRS